MNICAIIISYLGSENTIACVRSLLFQGIGKIVVMENSGEKNQKKILMEAFQGLDAVDVMASGVNMGFAGGINFVLKKVWESDFDGYLILNNDTIAPEGFATTLETGMARSCLDVAAPIIYAHPGRDTLWSRGHYYNNLTGLITSKPLPAIPRTYAYLTGCCLLVKREVFKQMGFFDDSFFLYGEDVEFCHRAASYGFRLGVVAESRLYHRISASSQNNSLLYEYHMARGHVLLAKKLCVSWLEYVITIFSKGGVLAIRALFRSVRYGNLNALRGYVKAILQGNISRFAGFNVPR